MRLSDSEIVRRALEDAISYNADLIECLSHSDPHLKSVKSRVKQMRRILEKNFTPRRDPLSGARLVPLSEILRAMRENDNSR